MVASVGLNLNACISKKAVLVVDNDFSQVYINGTLSFIP